MKIKFPAIDQLLVFRNESGDIELSQTDGDDHHSICIPLDFLPFVIRAMRKVAKDQAE